MNSFSLKNENTGLITNLLANDLSNIDERIYNIFLLVPFVIGTIGFSILITRQMGVVGMVGVFILLLSIPINHLISHSNGRLMEKQKYFKDKRIQIST